MLYFCRLKQKDSSEKDSYHRIVALHDVRR